MPGSSRGGILSPADLLRAHFQRSYFGRSFRGNVAPLCWVLQRKASVGCFLPAGVPGCGCRILSWSQRAPAWADLWGLEREKTWVIIPHVGYDSSKACALCRYSSAVTLHSMSAPNLTKPSACSSALPALGSAVSAPHLIPLLLLIRRRWPKCPRRSPSSVGWKGTDLFLLRDARASSLELLGPVQLLRAAPGRRP